MDGLHPTKQNKENGMLIELLKNVEEQGFCLSPSEVFVSTWFKITRNQAVC